MDIVQSFKPARDAKTCDTEAQAAKCLKHWTTAGHKENNGKYLRGRGLKSGTIIPTTSFLKLLQKTK